MRPKIYQQNSFFVSPLKTLQSAICSKHELVEPKNVLIFLKVLLLKLNVGLAFFKIEAFSLRSILDLDGLAIELFRLIFFEEISPFAEQERFFTEDITRK